MCVLECVEPIASKEKKCMLMILICCIDEDKDGNDYDYHYCRVGSFLLFGGGVGGGRFVFVFCLFFVLLFFLSRWLIVGVVG